ncbi:MAG: chorismate-binding protein [Marinilabiliaceae bacterium]|nr:chorismate-binding protein [Marinilabiliaceae bacterium]
MELLTKKQVLHKLINSGISYAVWRMPGQKDFNIVASHSVRVDLDEIFYDTKRYDGFVIVPFDVNTEKSVFIPSHFKWIGDIKTGDIKECNLNFESVDDEYVSTEKDDYIKQASYLISEIRTGVVNKAILSRIHVEYNVCGERDVIFYNLCDKYPDACVFFYNTPQTGQWMGASPELFVDVCNSSIRTVALAGTRKNSLSNNSYEQWRQKEIEEQAIVTDYIEDVLHRYEIKNIRKTSPFTVRAGHLLHIKTTFEFEMDTNNNCLGNLLFDLHPTPAVCGLPKQKALDMITGIETHKRLYYGGFIGYISNSNLTCYVNIRCMKIIGKDAVLFVGGGFTKDSNSEDEWIETVLKTKTLLSVLKNI